MDKEETNRQREGDRNVKTERKDKHTHREGRNRKKRQTKVNTDIGKGEIERRDVVRFKP